MARKPIGAASFERMMRGYTVVKQRPLEEEVRKPPDPVLPEAYIRWGRAPDYNTEDFNPKDDSRGFVTVEKELPPLWGDYDEEGRTWASIKVANPEDEEQFVYIPTVTAVALRGRDQSYPLLSMFGDVVTRPEQYLVSFKHDYSEVDPSPLYLKNEAEDTFQPVVVDPLTTIIEVGWPQEAFVLVSIMVRPRTSITFEAYLEEPMSTQVSLPDNPFGRYAENAGDEGYPQTPFMEVWQNGNVVDEKNGGPDSKESAEWYPLGVQNDEVSPPIPSTVVFNNVSPNSFDTKGDYLLKLPVDNDFSTWGQWIGENAGWGGCDGIATKEWVEVSPDPDPRIAGRNGCLYLWSASMHEGSTPQQRPSAPYYITASPANGQIYSDESTGVKYQWRLDTDQVHHANHTSSNSGLEDSVGGAFYGALGAPFPAQFPVSYIFRKWRSGGTIRYDANPFVFSLMMFDVASIKKWFRSDIVEQETEVEFSIHAGEASKPWESNSLLEESDFGGKIGQLRWVWVRGPKAVRDAAEKMKDMDLQHIPGFEPGPVVVDGPPAENSDVSPTWDEVWAALRDGTGYLDAADVAIIQGAIANEGEQAFPAGASIEDEIYEQVRFRVNYAQRSLVEE